jgi:internalin A
MAKEKSENPGLQKIKEAIRTQATKLDLSGLQLSVLPPEIGELTSLTWLDLRNNRLDNLPREIGQLKNLTMLDVSVNKLTTLPSEIGRLTKLRKLFLSHNQLSIIPNELTSLINLKHLDVRHNMLNIPAEIIEKVKDPPSILSYIAHTAVGVRKPLAETKILIVGQGSVGKTSLINQLISNKFNPEETKTDGIAITSFELISRSNAANEPIKIQLNIWDFGGQEIMHATHQFFLTKRSLYLLVLDSRLTQEENRVEYWLKIIQSFGGTSPILIIGNKVDQHPLDIDRTGLQKKYPNIVGIIETSAATGIGIEELRAAITKQVNYLPHVHDLLPETWFIVKSKLEGLSLNSNFITHDTYFELCAENKITDETSQRTLISFLHDLGILLYFQEDRHLAELGILKPQWVTNGVYKILNDKTVFAHKGLLSLELLDEILNTPDYPHRKRLFIVELMRKFELCYEIDDDIFLIPDLLPKDEPELQFNGIPAFEYVYPVLPSSVITRFIVRMNQRIDHNCVWRTGVLLEIDKNRALIKADIEDRKITIAIEGVEHTRRDVLSAIRYQLDEIHNSIKGLDPEKFVPVPRAIYAKPLKYEYLLKLERVGEETLLVEDGDELREIVISQVLNGVENEYQRKQTGGSVTNNFNINIGKRANIGNIILASEIQKSFNKAEKADIQPELKEALKMLAEAVDSMNKVLSKEQAAEVTEDLGKLVDEATKPTPNKKWYSVSIDGLIKAAENVEKVGEPVINLSRKVLSLLTGAAIK